jgi:hypothetical protein
LSTSELQACLGRIYADPAFRKLFFNDPDLTTAGYALRPEEHSALHDLDKDAIENFASSLVAKRRGAMTRSYPLTFGLGSARIDQYFKRYCAMNRVGGRHISREDALQFGPFLEASLADLGDAPKYAADLVRFEWMCIQVKPAADFMDKAPTAEIPTDETVPCLAPGTQLEHFGHDVTAITQHLAEHKETAPQGFDQSVWIVWRPADAIRQGLLTRINPPLAELIRMCDKRASQSDIVATYTEVTGDANAGHAIASAFADLFAKTILCARTQAGGQTS